MKGLSVLFVVASVVLARADNECPSEQEADWGIEKLLSHEDCHKFYKCTFGQPVEYTCPAELYFNIVDWQCDWKENVDCGDRIDPSAPTTEATSTIKPETTVTETETTTEAEADAETTEAKPETTLESTTEELTTKETTTEESTTAEPPTEESTTEVPTTKEPTTEKPTTEETTTEKLTTESKPESEAPTAAPGTDAPATEAVPEMEFQENGCPVDPHVHWLVPHEEDCNLFYYCVWGEKVLRECPASLHFNPVLQVCDWPRDAGCAVSFDKHIEGRRYMSQVEVSLSL